MECASNICWKNIKKKTTTSSSTPVWPAEKRSEMLGWCSLWMRKKGKHPRNSRNEIHPPSGDAKTSQEAEERHAQDPHVSKLRFHVHLLVGYWWQSTTAHKWTKDQEHVLYFCTLKDKINIVEILSNLGHFVYLIVRILGTSHRRNMACAWILPFT